MIRVTLKGLVARKLRLALTSLAIVLGVGMVCGTFILTDTVNAGVHDIISGAYAKADAVVSAKAVVGLFAAIFPARRAARLDILHALQYE